MARIKIRRLVVKPGAQGGLPRYFWQPSALLSEQGWQARRVPENWRDLADAGALEAAAIAAAQRLNAELDAARACAPAASQMPRPPGARTVAALIKLYKASEEWKRLAPTTRRGYDQCLARISAWAGQSDVRAITHKRIKALKAAGRKTPAMLNAILRTLRLLLEFAVGEEWIAVNPARRPGLVATAPSGLVWPKEAVAAFVAAADELGKHSIGTAVMLDEWIGQRQADVLRMPRSVFRGGELVLRQRKTGAGVTLPVGMVPQLVRRLEEEFARQAERYQDAVVKPSTLLVCEATGRAWRADHFRHAFAEVRAAMAKEHPRFAIDYLPPGRDMEEADAFTIAAEDLWFMHLRHTAITRLAEADCDPGLIAVISGHAERSVVAIIERYRIRTRKLARAAFQKRLDAEGAT